MLSKKLQVWKGEERVEREAEDKRRLGTKWTNATMDADEDSVVADSSDSDEDIQDLPEIKALKVKHTIPFRPLTNWDVLQARHR